MRAEHARMYEPSRETALEGACERLVTAIRHMGREVPVLDECWYAVDWAEAVMEGRNPVHAVLGMGGEL